MMKKKITFHVGYDGKDLDIPIRAVITFQLEKGSIDISLHAGEVRVYGSDGLIVKPMVSNAINLSVRR